MHYMDRSPGRVSGRWSRRGGLFVVFFALLFAIFGSGSASAATLTSDDFEDGDAAGWVTTGGTWIVANEESHVLRQSSLAANALARTGQVSWQDYTVTAKVKPTSFNGMPGFVGVVARAQSTTNFYALVVRADDTVALTRTINGSTWVLASARLTVSEDTVYNLSLKVDDMNLVGKVNGVEVSARDSFLYAGPAGLMSTWAVGSFDNVAVSTW